MNVRHLTAEEARYVRYLGERLLHLQAQAAALASLPLNDVLEDVAGLPVWRVLELLANEAGWVHDDLTGVLT